MTKSKPTPCHINSPCPTFYHVNFLCPIGCRAPFLLFLVTQNKEGASKSWTAQYPHANPSSPSHLGIFLRSFLVSFWASKRGFSAGYTIKNWRKFFFPTRERQRRRWVFFLTRSLEEGVLLLDFILIF